jgi:enoyl-CoA hydratase/carnithine racemase
MPIFARCTFSKDHLADPRDPICSDMVVASPRAVFGLPEASRGVYASAGGLARIVRICGLQIGSEIAMAGRQLSAEEALRFNVINKVSQTHESVVHEAVDMAKAISNFSPDAIIITRSGLRETWETGSVERASQRTDDRYGKHLREAENTRIGLEAFAQKKKPQWVPSKL